MPASLVLLYWPDFAESAPGGPHGPALLAHALHRHLTLRCPQPAAYAWAPSDPGTPSPAAIFERWGFSPLDREPDAELVAELVRGHADADPVLLLAGAERAAAWLGGLPPRDAVEVWTPGCARGEGLEGVRPVRLGSVLPQIAAKPVAFFAEWDVIDEALRRHGLRPSADCAFRALLQTAELAGPVVTARVYGVGEPAELAGAVTGRSAVLPIEPDGPSHAGDSLRDALCRLIEDPEAPRTWIVASHGRWLPEILHEARERGIRTVLWTAGDGVPAPVRALADADDDLFGLLSRKDALAEPARAEGAGRHVAAWKPPLDLLDAVEAALDGAACREEDLPDSSEAFGARLGPWVRLVYHVECLLRQNQWTKIAFRKLAAAMAEIDEFGPTPANVLMWLNRAKAEGILLVEQETLRAEPVVRVTTCRPNAEHPVVRAAVEVPERCLRLLHQMLHKMPWVSFKLLRSVLRRDQWLGRPPYRLEEASIDEWLNFLIHDGAITMTKEPNLVNPEYPVTALRLNERHPMSRAVVTEAVEGTRLAAERAILAVDHFLTRQRKPWMSMTALRRSLEGMGRDELQEVLQALQSLGALVTESYPNPQKEHFTTGCRLKPDEPIVLDALNTRNAIIRVTQYHQRYRSWVPLAKVDEEVSQQAPHPVWTAQRVAWFLLLRDEGILELDHEGPLPESAWGTVRCRLNVGDAVVRTVVAECHEVAGG